MKNKSKYRQLFTCLRYIFFQESSYKFSSIKAILKLSTSTSQSIYQQITLKTVVERGLFGLFVLHVEKYHYRPELKYWIIVMLGMPTCLKVRFLTSWRWFTTSANLNLQQHGKNH